MKASTGTYKPKVQKLLHVVAIERVPAFSSLSTCRQAKCGCGWEGSQRGTLEMAADDGIQHEREHCAQ